MNPNQLSLVAAKLASSLDISFFIRDGHIYQHGPGERIDPPSSARPDLSHGITEIDRMEGLKT